MKLHLKSLRRVKKKQDSMLESESQTSRIPIAVVPKLPPKPELTYEDVMKDQLFLMVPSLWNESVPFPSAVLKQYYTPTTGTGIKSCLQPISKEISNLLQLLPCNRKASIFARVEEGRIDGMKVVMTGPVGTPYAYGCFEFNVFFPPNYPHVPPTLKLITTGSGTVRFNPNLYETGYVCVSLLGTWPATKPEECWQPNKSTLLQVLVSIQSLIMTEFPYFNEPGYEVHRSPTYPASLVYNRNLHIQTVKFAILGQLRNASLLDTGGFGKVIRNHFYLNKNEVKDQVRKWANADMVHVITWNTLIMEVEQEFEKLVALEE
ncbi:Baculoviral IAP repeat-containing protein 6 [Rhizoclosmatium sp. JEL0117]|nr:Baculoviral IAP repeat-containing protein 6 [Rhizoclosmatium sp. JEL0117]